MPQATPKWAVGAEPIPGYRLLEPLGRGGFGEVWKCVAPGGLLKAVKFVRNGEDGGGAATQELEALQRVKEVRHPFILSLERVELVGEVLVIVMELADQNLHDLHLVCREHGLPGVPREVLLGFLQEAAEALDWMNFEHGLQHLDIKPHNLFVVSNHLKVADFGLVNHVDQAGTPRRRGGVTPLYASPEILRGGVSPHSDQYSLAVVYQELLTGAVPFWDETTYGLITRHLSEEPDLRALPGPDQPVVARALAKVPEARFPSCLEFIHALEQLNSSGGGTLRRSGQWRRVLLSWPDPSLSGETTRPGGPTLSSRPSASTPGPPWSASGGQTTTLVTPELPGAPVAPSAALTEQPGPAPLTDLPGTSHYLPPTSVSLPGYRFQHCIHQGPLGELWRVQDDDGRPGRALCLPGFVHYDTDLIEHLRRMRHPSLPPTEVHWSQAERLVLVTPAYERNLRERFEQCRAEGLPGVPREELLGYLRSVAEALDALAGQFNLRHLALNPSRLLLEGARAWVADFGLVPLVWQPTGQLVASLNPRYAAPELYERLQSDSADQYSLALIYVELVTGTHPRPHRPPASGSRRIPGARIPRPDLDLFPPAERDVLARALHHDPQQRFPSCTAFLDALGAARTPAPPPENLYASLPSVIPFSSLLGEPARASLILPSLAQVVAQLSGCADPRGTPNSPTGRYLIHEDGTWEYSCPVQLLPGSLRLKVDGFRDCWNAELLDEEESCYRLGLELPAPSSFWERCFAPPRRLEITVLSEPPGPSRRVEVRVRIRASSGEPERMGPLLEKLAPQLFDSLRGYLQPAPEQRTEDRHPLPHAFHFYPVLPDLDVREALEATGKNISLSGISFRTPSAPPAEVGYLHFYAVPELREVAVLVQVLRAGRVETGCEVAGRFGLDC